MHVSQSPVNGDVMEVRCIVWQADEAAAVMTQLPPERAAALVLSLASGDALPGFHAQAVDAWDNATGPADALLCEVTVECEALSPAQSSFQIPASGRAFVEGTSLKMPHQDHRDQSIRVHYY